MTHEDYCALVSAHLAQGSETFSICKDIRTESGGTLGLIEADRLYERCLRTLAPTNENADRALKRRTDPRPENFKQGQPK